MSERPEARAAGWNADGSYRARTTKEIRRPGLAARGESLAAFGSPARLPRWGPVRGPRRGSRAGDPVRRPMHPCASPTRLPRWGPRRRLRCSSLKYSRNSRSSRLAGGRLARLGATPDFHDGTLGRGRGVRAQRPGRRRFAATGSRTLLSSDRSVAARRRSSPAARRMAVGVSPLDRGRAPKWCAKRIRTSGRRSCSADIRLAPPGPDDRGTRVREI
jgi:hypothetical protein